MDKNLRACCRTSWRFGCQDARLTFAALTALVLGGLVVHAGDKLEFNRDIRPILAENCFACHGPDKNARKAGLRLDQRELAVSSGTITPGKPNESALIERIFSNERSHIMPPPKSHKKLTAVQKDTLRLWIAAGAEYQPHWSFIPPKRPALPAVQNTSWVRNPIDQFILAELEKRGWQPAPEADRRTLARRLSLDLTGLPPSLAQVDAFVNDRAPDAYERFVDGLVGSPHWGEHRCRYWLDSARYADTHGIHFDNYREIWSYRDWVISAFNRNLPFDRFTLEQLAGDLLPNHTLDQWVASGFNRCNITTNEGGAISEEYLVFYTRDRTETTSKVWLGLTANCAVCHDHKFDPISTREFYSMAAFFNNTTQQAMDGNIKDTPPTILVPRSEDLPQWQKATKELGEVRTQADVRKLDARPQFEHWLATARGEQVVSEDGTHQLQLHAPLSEGTGSLLHYDVYCKAHESQLAKEVAWDAGHVGAKGFKSQPGRVLEVKEIGDFEKNQAFAYGAWVKLTKRAQFGSLLARMDNQHDYRGWDLWVENNRIAAHFVHKWPEDAFKVVANTPVKLGQWNHLFVTYDGSGEAAGAKIYFNGVLQEMTIAVDNLRNSIRTTVPFKVAQRHAGQAVEGAVLQDLRVYARTLSGLEVAQVARQARAAWLAAKPALQRTPAEKEELFDWWLPAQDPLYQRLTTKLNSLKQDEAAIRARGTVAHVMQERREMPMAYILFRGEYDKRGDPVKPDVPKALPPMPADLPRTRLGFAQWLLKPEHPLTARVTVNRFWQEVFGTGLVKTADDFGITGDLPSHPDLLDWLAVEFRESGWNVKQFYKLLVTSAAYRQAAVTTAEKLEMDPQNRLLARGPRFRMDAEMIRDYALAASGLLVEKVGGPSVKPYQPEGVWEAVAIIGSDTRDYQRDSGDKLYRRSLYTFWKRSAPPASLEIFNAPNRETCTVRRERTNTPLQALVTLNDPQFVEAARRLAENALKAETPGTGVEFLARRLLVRPLRRDEATVVKANLNDLLDYYKAHVEDAKKLISVGESKADPALDTATLAAWTMLANELMNLDEVINK